MVQATKTLLEEFAQEFGGSRRLWGEASDVIPSGVTHDARYVPPPGFPLYIDRAAGSKKVDVDGHELIDYAVGHGALILGHNHPAVTEAVAAQLQKGTHFSAGHRLEIEWADLIREIVPTVRDTKGLVRFTSSGTEATLMAMRLARIYTRREKILKLAGNFHGWHDFAIVGEQPPFDVPSRPHGVPQATVDSIDYVLPGSDDEILTTVERKLADGSVAGVILEPTGASWATVPFDDTGAFLRALRGLADAYGSVLIFDEVITGFRWAPGGAQERFGVTPDVTTMAKIVAGGLPGGAVAGRPEIMRHLAFDAPEGRKMPHPGTFNANPLSAAAGAACLRIVGNAAVQQRCDELAGRLRAGMNKALAGRGVPGFVYGESSVFHIVLGQTCDNMTDGDLRKPSGVAPVALKKPNAGQIGLALNAGMLLGGVHFFSGGGMLSNAHSDADIDKTLDAFDTTIARMQGEGIL